MGKVNKLQDIISVKMINIAALIRRFLRCNLPPETYILATILCFLFWASFLPTSRRVSYIPYSEIFENILYCPPLIPSVSLSLCPLLDLNQPRRTRVYRFLNETKLKALEKTVMPGGSWKPLNCQSQHRVAIVIPYRNRPKHLQLFLQHMHSFLQRQQIEYTLYVVEQTAEHAFNRGKLFNIGFAETSKKNHCCYIFHDVDLLPENPLNTYSCSNQPRHMCASIDTFRYVLPYPEIFGGALAISAEQFATVNGFSNRFFGWGAEDDDMARRVREAGMGIVRFDLDVSRYVMLSHSKEKPNPDRYALLKEANGKTHEDGISTLDYKVIKTELLPLYTRILVNVKP